MHLAQRQPIRLGHCGMVGSACSIALLFSLAVAVCVGQTLRTSGDSRATAAVPTDDPSDRPDERQFRTESVRGKVVWLAEALNAQFEISSVPEANQRTLAIQTEDGKLLPIVEDLRGRSFRTDDRLRKMSVELLVRRHQHHPMLQVLRIYELKDDKRYEVDYWCDVCAIVMFEKGPCACCQDDNRLRKRLVK